MACQCPAFGVIISSCLPIQDLSDPIKIVIMEDLLSTS